MTEDILEIWRQRDREALDRLHAFNERFFGNHKAEAKKPVRGKQGVVYGRLWSRLSLPEVLRRLKSVEVPKPEKDAIRQALYPEVKS